MADGGQAFLDDDGTMQRIAVHEGPPDWVSTRPAPPEWEDVTGGSNGILGIWPRAPFDSRPAFYLLTLALTVAGILLLRRFLFAPFGYAMRAGRDSALRAEAIGINVKHVHWIGFAIAGAFAGVAGGVFAFAKGTISPDVAWVSCSTDAGRRRSTSDPTSSKVSRDTPSSSAPTTRCTSAPSAMGRHIHI